MECIVCKSAVKIDAVSTACGHIFHGQCLHAWIKKFNACPQCESEVNITHLRPLELASSTTPSRLQAPIGPDRHFEIVIAVIKMLLELKNSIDSRMKQQTPVIALKLADILIKHSFELHALLRDKFKPLKNLLGPLKTNFWQFGKQNDELLKNIIKVVEQLKELDCLKNSISSPLRRQHSELYQHGQ